MLKKRTHRRSTIAIKRVIAQGNVFICGVCRKTYNDSNKANQCLEGCLRRHLNPDNPVADVAGTGPKKYRCHYCRRIYLERNDAVACAAECREHTKETVKREHADGPVAVSPRAVAAAISRSGSSSGATPVSAPRGAAAPATPAPAAPKARPTVRRDQMHKFFRDGRKLICRKCGAEKKTLDEVIACYDSHPLREKTERPAKEEKAPVKAESAPRTPGLTNEDEKFLRDGARYVCRNCNSKFFTRGEVIACFDGHNGQPAAKPEETSVAAPPPEAAPVKSGPGLTNEDEKFFRDGARYICRTCQKKHFTRGDVTACFDSH